MEALHKQIFDSFCRACPDTSCGLYNAAHRLVAQNGEGLPEKAPSGEGTSFENDCFLTFARLEESWLLGFCAKEEAQAQGMLRLLASIRELVLQNQKLYVVRSNAQDKISLLLNRLFSLNTPDDIAYTAIAALNLGYDMTLPRTVCLFTLAAQDDESAISEGTLHSVINLIRSQRFIGAQDLVGSINSDQIALCKTLSNPAQPVQSQLRPLLASLCASILDLHHISIQVGVGDVVRSISDYSTQFLDIRQMLRCRTLFNSPKTIHFIANFQTEMAIFKIPSAQLDHFLIEKLEILEHLPQFLETVEALLSCNMNINDTAEMLFVHRNTVLFRVNRIKKLLCLDPLHKDADRATLALLYMYSKVKQITAPS